MGVHDGHRKRMLESFLESGIDSMHPHEILEMLLFFAIPRRDTNEIAHELIQTFGTLRGVFDAPIRELVKVKGIGEYAATLIRMIPEMARAYLSDFSGDFILQSNRDAAQYFLPRFIGRTNETVMMLCLDNKNKVISCSMVCEGSVNAVAVNSRRIIQIAMQYNASSIIIAHNHPGGIALPSYDDICTTKKLMDLCASLKVPLLDHIVVSDGDYVSMAETGMVRRLFM